MTIPQMAHLQAAEAGALFANDHGGVLPPRAVWVGGKARQAVVERLLADRLLTLVEVPGQSVCREVRPTETGRAVLAGAR